MKPPASRSRRRFLQSSAALAGTAGPGLGTAAAKPLSFRYGYSAISWGTNIEEAIRIRTGESGIDAI